MQFLSSVFEISISLFHFVIWRQVLRTYNLLYMYIIVQCSANLRIWHSRIVRLCVCVCVCVRVCVCVAP